MVAINPHVNGSNDDDDDNRSEHVDTSFSESIIEMVEQSPERMQAMKQHVLEVATRTDTYKTLIDAEVDKDAALAAAVTEISVAVGLTVAEHLTNEIFGKRIAPHMIGLALFEHIKNSVKFGMAKGEEGMAASYQMLLAGEDTVGTCKDALLILGAHKLPGQNL